MMFSVGQKVWDRYAGKVGVIVSIENNYFYKVDEGFGGVLCCEADLEDYDTATTFRAGKIVKVSEADKEINSAE